MPDVARTHGSGITIEPLSWEDSLLEDLESQCTQVYFMRQYAAAIMSGQEIDWPKVNHAAIDRWSPGGFRRVKEGAWKLVAIVRANA